MPAGLRNITKKNTKYTFPTRHKKNYMLSYKNIGRLAQLGEHLVYTQVVGSSILSPPIVKASCILHGAFFISVLAQLFYFKEIKCPAH